MDFYVLGEESLTGAVSELCRQGSKRTAAANRRQPGRKSPAGRKFKAGFELTITSPGLKQRNIIRMDKALRPGVPILTTSVTVPVSVQAGWVRHPERLVGISAFPTLIGNALIEVAPGPLTDRKILDTACAILRSIGKETAIVKDRVGMVMPRILCMLINESFFGAMENIAEPASIDTAMKLGTHYPFGPIEWAQRIGIGNVLAVLGALQDEFGEERYRAAPLLRDCVRSGLLPLT